MVLCHCWRGDCLKGGLWGCSAWIDGGLSERGDTLGPVSDGPRRRRVAVPLASCARESGRRKKNVNNINAFT